ncbi:MAG TPA: condensation domain-containing protein [Pyrinomonadaceae bacterium]|jgi:hypothetical protein
MSESASTPGAGRLTLRGRRRRDDEPGRPAPSSIPRRECGDLCPLSFSQQRLWFLEKLNPGSVVYNLPGAVRLEGELDAAAFERALAEVIRRHETLRTTFTLSDGQPAQRIADGSRFRLRTIDLSARPEARRQAEVERLAQEDDRPFDLERGPLMRASLVRISPREHILLFNFHHIIFDGWSANLIVNEISQLYPAFAAGLPSPLPELPIQYADFALWQRRSISGERLAQLLDYWRSQLLPLPRGRLPTDHPRSADTSGRGGTHTFALDLRLAAALKLLAQESGVTLFMLLLAAWQTLLFRYSGEERISVGSPVANRPRHETEQLMGFFVNTLVLCTDLSGDPSFGQLLARVREVCLGAYAHQELPFEKLVEEIQPDRSPIQTPLFQTWFVLHNTPARSAPMPGLRVTPFETERRAAMFDLMLLVQESEDGAACALRYDADLFEEQTVAGLAGRFKTLLEEVSRNPSCRLLDIPLESDDAEPPAASDAGGRGADEAEDEFIF